MIKKREREPILGNRFSIVKNEDSQYNVNLSFLKILTFQKANIFFCDLCETYHLANSKNGLKHSLIRNVFGIFRQNSHEFELEYNFAKHLT